jgi:hypothetical protein
MEVPRPVHVIPSCEYAMVLVPEPTATQKEPVQQTLLPCVEKTVAETAVHALPSAEYAMEFVPAPTATH